MLAYECLSECKPILLGSQIGSDDLPPTTDSLLAFAGNDRCQLGEQSGDFLS
jgi:hypothetical protein